jgi:hypothetical protein
VGHFSTRGKVPEIADARVAFFKGWFEDTFKVRIVCGKP